MPGKIFADAVMDFVVGLLRFIVKVILAFAAIFVICKSDIESALLAATAVVIVLSLLSIAFAPKSRPSH